MPGWGLLEIGATVGAVMTMITLITWLVRTLKKVVTPLQEIRTATLSSLKYSMARAHREYTQNGRISRIALECVCDMFSRYKALGGNGFIDTLINELKNLPIDIS